MNVRGLAASVLAASVTAYGTVRYRRWHLRWGATDDELTLRLPSDDMVQRSHFNFTRAITIQARPRGRLALAGPARLRPGRLVQLRPTRQPGPASAEQIIPELQQLQVGDWISMSGKPRPATAMRVKAFQPNQWLLWEHRGCPWVWVLKPIDQETTRLITEGRNRYTLKDVIFSLGPVLMELSDPFMMRKQLRNLKRRAEQLAATRRPKGKSRGGQRVPIHPLELDGGRGTIQLRETPGDLSGSGSGTHQDFSPAHANCCYSLLLDPDATMLIDLHKWLFLLITGRGK